MTLTFTELLDRMPLVKLAVPFIAGMLLARCVMDVWAVSEALLWGAGFVLCLCVFAAFYAGKVAEGKAHQQTAAGWPVMVFGTSFNLLMVVAGFLLFTHAYRSSGDKVPIEGCAVEGVLTGVPQEKAKTWAVSIRLDNGGDLLAYVAKDQWRSDWPWEAGRRVNLTPFYVRPTCPSVPDTSDTSGQFSSYRSYLFYKGVVATCYVFPGGCTLLDTLAATEREQDWTLRAARLRNTMHRLYHEAFEAQTASVVEAMTIGEKASLDRQLKADFATAGISHLLALSGFHLSILLTILNVLLMRFWLPLRLRRTCVLLLIPVVWVYTFFVGAPASLVRAAVMCTLLQVSMAFAWTTQMPNSLAAAALIMLAINPLSLMQVGFQLSFASMLGIACIAQPCMKRWWDWREEKWTSGMDRRWWKAATLSLLGFLLSGVIVTVAASLFTLPLVAFHFGRVPLLSVLSNLLASVLSLLIMWGVVIWWLCTLTGVGTHVVEGGIEWLAGALTGWAERVAGLPLASVSFELQVWELIPLYATLFAALAFSVERRISLLYVCLLSLLAFFLMQLLLH